MPAPSGRATTSAKARPRARATVALSWSGTTPRTSYALTNWVRSGMSRLVTDGSLARRSEVSCSAKPASGRGEPRARPGRRPRPVGAMAGRSRDRASGAARPPGPHRRAPTDRRRMESAGWGRRPTGPHPTLAERSADRRAARTSHRCEARHRWPMGRGLPSGRHTHTSGWRRPTADTLSWSTAVSSPRGHSKPALGGCRLRRAAAGRQSQVRGIPAP